MPVDLVGVTGDAAQGGLNYQAYGDVAQRFLNSRGDVGSMRSLAVLQKDEWDQYDQAVVQIAQERFSFISDLMGAGLRYGLSNPMGVMSVTWDRISDMDPAQIDMTAESVDVRDRVTYEQESIPIPIIHKGFRLNLRHLEASRSQGLALDTAHAMVATRNVVETIEDTAIKGTFATGTGGAGSLYGLTNYPHRNTYTLGGAWTGRTAVQIKDDVLSMMQAARDDFMYGPYKLYLPTAYQQKMDDDYDTTTSSGRTIRERLLQIEGIQSIGTNHFLPANNVVLVQMTSDVEEVIDGIQPRLIEWQSHGGMVFEYKVLAIMPVRFKRDGNNSCGIVHGAS